MVSRVVPAVGLTMARSKPSSRLSKLDFPAFGRPQIANRTPSRRIRPSSAVASSCQDFVTTVTKFGEEEVAGGGVDTFFGEVDVRLDVSDEVEEVIADVVNLLADAALELLGGGGSRPQSLRADEIHDGLGLGEIEFAVEKGALGELAGTCARRTRLEHRLQHASGDEDAAVAADLDDVLAGVTRWRGVGRDDDLVDGRAGAVHDPTHDGRPRRRGGGAFEDDSDHFQSAGAGQPDDRDGSLARRRRQRGDGRIQHSTKVASTGGVRQAVPAERGKSSACESGACRQRIGANLQGQTRDRLKVTRSTLSRAGIAVPGGSRFDPAP